MLASRGDSIPITGWRVWYYSLDGITSLSSEESSWGEAPIDNVLAVEWFHDGLRTLTHGVDYYALTADEFGGSDALADVVAHSYKVGLLIDDTEYNEFLTNTLNA